MIISLPGWAPFGNHFLALRGASSHPRRLCVGSSGEGNPEVAHGINLTPASPNTKKLDLAYISTPNRDKMALAKILFSLHRCLVRPWRIPFNPLQTTSQLGDLLVISGCLAAKDPPQVTSLSECRPRSSIH